MYMYVHLFSVSFFSSCLLLSQNEQNALTYFFSMFRLFFFVFFCPQTNAQNAHTYIHTYGMYIHKIMYKKLVVMIAVVDIQTNNAYSYGEETGLDRRVFIIYDGIHYDGERAATARAIL